MNSIAQLSGTLSVRVDWHEGVIERMTLNSSRPRQVTQLLCGKPIDQALTLVPMIYSLCGVAQKVAALRAAESALGLEVSAEVDQARRVLVLAETARELGLRLSQHWFADAVSGKSQAVKLIQWFTAVNAELQWALELNPTHGRKTDTLNYAVDLKAILHPMVGTESELGCVLFGNAEANPLKAHVRDLQEQFGAVKLNCAAAPLPGVKSNELHSLLADTEHALAQDDGAQFAARPSWKGACHETSAWTRNRDVGLVVQGQSAGLSALALRFLALASELQVLPARMRSVEVCSGRLWQGTGAVGIGAIEAARGLLIHRIELEGEIVRDYKIVAPTEWNFHPQGTLVQMLEGVKVSRERLYNLVEKLILLVDPCVDWEIEIGN